MRRLTEVLADYYQATDHTERRRAVLARQDERQYARDQQRWAARDRRTLRDRGQVVLIAGNDTITAYSLRGAVLAGVLPCSVDSIKMRRKRYRAVFPDPIYREGQTDYWLAEELEVFWRQYGKRDARSVLPVPAVQVIEARLAALDDQPMVPVNLPARPPARNAARVPAQFGRTRVPGPTRTRVTRNPRSKALVAAMAQLIEEGRTLPADLRASIPGNRQESVVVSDQPVQFLRAARPDRAAPAVPALSFPLATPAGYLVGASPVPHQRL